MGHRIQFKNLNLTFPTQTRKIGTPDVNWLTHCDAILVGLLNKFPMVDIRYWTIQIHLTFG